MPLSAREIIFALKEAIAAGLINEDQLRHIAGVVEVEIVNRMAAQAGYAQPEEIV